ncbi:hypothetical protein CDL15_Pgr016421 [Punica granatum]|uniref:Uncharacterized protein n=1 Tax=Punica granatum TaxID=22663 RepID=A0A218XRA5_PUNGR|nr:hypothetical protein CDL15_Pgr016421 [Punica granatum]
MATNGGGERGGNSQQQQPPPPARSTSGRRIRSRPDPLLVVCRCFSVITSISAILCIAVNIWSAIRSFKGGYDVLLLPPSLPPSFLPSFLPPSVSMTIPVRIRAVHVFDGIFRCYAVLIAFFVVLAETEWGFIIKFWKIFSTALFTCWFLHYDSVTLKLRIVADSGVLGWKGVAVMTRAFPSSNEADKELILLQNIAAYLLLACGVVYVFSGILCIGFLKRSRQRKETSREQAVQDLEELERRREELEQLLIAEERGILCIGFLKRSRQRKETSREQAVQDLEELERRREELEQLLIAEERV